MIPEMTPEGERETQSRASHQPAVVAPTIASSIGVQRDQSQEHGGQQLNQWECSLGDEPVGERTDRRTEPAYLTYPTKRQSKEQQRGRVAGQQDRDPDSGPDHVPAHNLGSPLGQGEAVEG
jgi:hypothetical protein